MSLFPVTLLNLITLPSVEFLIDDHTEITFLLLLRCQQITAFRNLKLAFYRAMHFSAKRGIAIACRLSVRLSVCLSVCL